MDPDRAVELVATRLRLPRERPTVDAETGASPASLDRRTSRLGRLLLPGPSRTHALNHIVSELFDTGEPPFFKSFLRLEVDADALRITCHGVSGYHADEQTPTVEDTVTIPLRGRQTAGA